MTAFAIFVAACIVSVNIWAAGERIAGAIDRQTEADKESK